jgi:hypothetical protein
VPDPKGETVITRYSLRELLDNSVLPLAASRAIIAAYEA